MAVNNEAAPSVGSIIRVWSADGRTVREFKVADRDVVRNPVVMSGTELSVEHDGEPLQVARTLGAKARGAAEFMESGVA